MKTIFPKSRKGQLFTILAILLIILMFTSFEIFSTIHERNAIKARVSTMDSFLKSIEKNLERQLYISGYRVIFLAENEITVSGRFIENFTAFSDEAFYNGTVNGVANNITFGATYSDIIDSVNNKASKINVNISMTNTTIEFKQDDPWNIRFSMVSDFIMADKQGLARWEKRQNIFVLIPVEGFEDPLFIIGTKAHVSRKINRTIYEGNYTPVANLRDHVDKEYYAANSNAPSFLKRLRGNLSADPNGIEGFVKIPELPEDVQINKGVKSCIDYIYFSGDNPQDYGVTGMPSWFRIDNIDGHCAKYNVTCIFP